jgi:hypothetical protein
LSSVVARALPEKADVGRQPDDDHSEDHALPIDEGEPTHVRTNATQLTGGKLGAARSFRGSITFSSPQKKAEAVHPCTASCDNGPVSPKVKLR